jgi:carbonic anhydrase/acetyltransferase-like protein (isoleucine patch superfamily)
VLIARNGVRPEISPEARVAPTAIVVGNVVVGPGSYLDHGVLIESSGPPVVLGGRVAVMANAVIRSIGGTARPEHPVDVGAGTLIGPQSTLLGCRIGADSYVATGVIVFQGAVVGPGSRLGAGAIVHTGTELPPESRVGLRSIAVASKDGPVITSDIDRARELVGASDFFRRAFGVAAENQIELHRAVLEHLHAEVDSWRDELL